MKNYQKFCEALKISQYRKYHQNFNKERYSDIFSKYDGDKNHYRIYIPLTEKENTLETEIKDYLNTLNIDIIDYKLGSCKYKDAKNPSKISQILNKNNADLFKKFVEDPIRKAGSDLIVCISRHAYDIAGADTDRDWTNCMTIGAKITPRLKKLEDELKSAMEKNDEKEKKRIKEKIKDLKKDGCNVKYLLQDVKQGSLIAYLIKKDDKNINNPIADLNIKPFENVNEPKNVILVADKSMYGHGTEDFKATVNKWLDEVNDMKKDTQYKLKDKLYDDGTNAIGYDFTNIPLKTIFIDCSNCDLKDLNGIEKAKSLKKLDCNVNKLTSLDPIKNLINLDQLYCSENRISSLEGIENLTNLIDLCFSKNEITSLEGIENLTKLETIICYTNKISSLKGIENLIDLSDLYCDDNKITSIKGIENLTKLTGLYCENNPIDWLDYIDKKGNKWYIELPKSIIWLRSDKFKTIQKYWEFMDENQPK